MFGYCPPNHFSSPSHQIFLFPSIRVSFTKHIHVERALFQLLHPSKQLKTKLEDAMNKAMQNAMVKKCAQNESECKLRDDGSNTAASP